MPEIRITVRNKIAEAVGKPVIVCGNSDYTLLFDLDAEWEPYRAKTARFYRYDNRRGCCVHTDVLFEGSSVAVPVLRDTHEVAVGIFAGALHAAVPVRIPCLPAVTDGADITDPLPPDLYTQLFSYIRDIAEETAVMRTALVQTGISGVRLARGSFEPPEDTEV